MSEFLVTLASASMICVGNLDNIISIQTLRDLGVAEMLQGAVDKTKAAAGILASLSLMPSLGHVQPQTLLSLAWPRYLQELAASKTPITQACLRASSGDTASADPGQRSHLQQAPQP